MIYKGMDQKLVKKVLKIGKNIPGLRFSALPLHYLLALFTS